ncbi:MAG: B12-binding domain-containing radical SAM protein [Proteobacteria bacterium]|nr:B12-binding domain-containing radical SAM protein [Pseudomonadota bacterium]
MKRNILLINPWIYDFAAYDFWLKPLGLLYIAGFLRKNGYNVHLVDCLNPAHPEFKHETHIKPPKRKSWGNGNYPKENIWKPEPLADIPKRYNRYGITLRIFRKELLGIKRPDLVFVTSMMTYWYPGVFEAIKIIRETLPGVPVVLGGNYVTLCPSHASENSCADFTIAGEGERNIPNLLKDIFGDDPLFIPDLSDLDSYPLPAFDLMPNKDQVPILTSKGCPYRCTYCASHILNNGFRRRDPIKVVDEIEYWNKLYGITNFSFYDDALLVDSKASVIPMLKEIIKRELGCNFHCPNGLHLREITGEISNLMFRAGFRTIRFGLETASVKRQIETGGKITNEELKETAAHLKNAGYRSRDIGVYLLCGLPGQAASEVRESINLVKSCGAKPIIAEFSPIPGTPIWKESVKASPYNISKEPLFHNNSLLSCRGEELTYEMYRELKMLARTGVRDRG